jgi:2-polyprenyl-3-methyl-5-hydroxy-6-metoxy-1,4-benzoquinol methylase
MPRDGKLYFYDTIAERFDAVANPYDLHRRLEIVFDELLGAEDLSGRSILDAGCGTGWFSQRAAARGARVTALDIGLALLRQVRQKTHPALVAADVCLLPFRDGAFDVVISSECIEHTLDPRRALSELARVTRPGGLLLVTVPNRAWRFSATIAAWLRLRPYEGYEHWLGWREMRRLLGRAGVSILEMRGFHLVPPLARASWALLRSADRYGRTLGPVMLNIAVLARKHQQEVRAARPATAPGRAQRG